MSKWKTVTTTDFAEVISGATPSTNVQEYWDGDIEWVTPVDLSKLKSRFLISTIRKISKKGLENSSTRLIPAFNVVMSSRAPIGYFAIPMKNFTTNQGCKSFKFYPDHDPEYFYYNFLFNIDYFKRYGSGSTFMEISKSDIEKLSFFIPISPNEQRKIAHILSSVDIVIEKTEAAIAKYEAIKTGMMHDLFTRGIDLNTGKLRPSYEEAPEIYKESELGWIPKDWDVKPLSRLTTQIGDGIHTTPKYSTNTPYFFINGNNLTNGRIVIPSECPCVDEEEYKKHFQDLNNRTILYSINGTIGNIAFYDSEKVILGKSAAYISCSKKICLEYIYFNLQTDAVTNFYKREMTGSTINNLSLASIRNTPIACPKNNDEQNEIAKRLNSINKKIEIEHLFLSKYQQLKQGLMSDLLTCKVRVKYEEDKVEAV